jgi:methionyl-tRNA formyltransferase
MSIVPDYRGMDVVEWPILHGEPDKVGLTVHVMDSGIDTGDILSIRTIKPHQGEGFAI